MSTFQLRCPYPEGMFSSPSLSVLCDATRVPKKEKGYTLLPIVFTKEEKHPCLDACYCHTFLYMPSAYTAVIVSSFLGVSLVYNCKAKSTTHTFPLTGKCNN